MTRRFAGATSRNREPILRVLERIVRPGADVLEIASGTGEHATFFGERLPVATWQPSDPDPDARLSVDAWREALGESVRRVRPAIELDVTRSPWPVERADVVVCINMIHIAPWSACLALLDGAAEVLGEGGTLFMYGPYKQGGQHTAPSNEAFDAMLRGRDPAWGVRDLEEVIREADARGFRSEEVVPMPANNLSLVFRIVTK